jgi:hypothetical protein
MTFYSKISKWGNYHSGWNVCGFSNVYVDGYCIKVNTEFVVFKEMPAVHSIFSLKTLPLETLDQTKML